MLTGNPKARMDSDDAAKVVGRLAENLHFTELTADDVLQAMKSAKKRGVRGVRIHDFLHAAAAKIGNATKILTLDKYDFSELTELEIEVI